MKAIVDKMQEQMLNIFKHWKLTGGDGVAGSHTTEERTVLDTCACGIHRKGPLKLEAIFIFLRKGAVGCVTSSRKLRELVLGELDGARPNQLKGSGSWSRCYWLSAELLLRQCVCQQGALVSLPVPRLLVSPQCHLLHVLSSRKAADKKQIRSARYHKAEFKGELGDENDDFLSGHTPR